MLFFLWYSTPKALFIIYLANPLLMGYEFLCSCVEHSYGRTLTTTFAKKLVTLNYARKKKMCTWIFTQLATVHKCDHLCGHQRPKPGALRQLRRAGVGQHRGQRQWLKCNVRLQSVDSAHQGEVPDSSTFMKAVMLEVENRRLNALKRMTHRIPNPAAHVWRCLKLFD